MQLHEHMVFKKIIFQLLLSLIIEILPIGYDKIRSITVQEGSNPIPGQLSSLQRFALKKYYQDCQNLSVRFPTEAHADPAKNFHTFGAF